MTVVGGKLLEKTTCVAVATWFSRLYGALALERIYVAAGDVFLDCVSGKVLRVLEDGNLGEFADAVLSGLGNAANQLDDPLAFVSSLTVCTLSCTNLFKIE